MIRWKICSNNNRKMDVLAMREHLSIEGNGVMYFGYNFTSKITITFDEWIYELEHGEGKNDKMEMFYERRY